MAFTTKLLHDLFAPPDVRDWTNHPSIEAYAFALCEAGVPTAEAKALLRAAMLEVEELLFERQVEVERQAREDEYEARRIEGAQIAAERLLHEVGWGAASLKLAPEEDPWLG